MPNVLYSNIPSNQVGGARVLKTGVIIAGKKRMSGDMITEEDFLSIKPANRNALINKEYISPYPKDPAGTSRHVVQRNDGKFDVVVGLRANVSPFATKEEAVKYADQGTITDALSHTVAPSVKRIKAE
jgi:hypothetical protein